VFARAFVIVLVVAQAIGVLFCCRCCFFFSVCDPLEAEPSLSQYSVESFGMLLSALPVRHWSAYVCVCMCVYLFVYFCVYEC
jgi:hypothetical protein